MGKHPIDHDRNGDSKAAREYARVEREQAEPMSDPKIKSMTRSAHSDEDKSLLTRLRKFLNIDRQGTE